MISKSKYEQIKNLIENGHSNNKIKGMIGCSDATVAKVRNGTILTEKGGGESRVETVKEVITIHEEHRLKRENAALKRTVEELLYTGDVRNAYIEFANAMTANPITVPPWQQKKRSNNKDVATVCAHMSDWHLDEVVKLDQINGCNEFNRQIALARCGNFFDHTVELAKTYTAGVEIEGLVLSMGGDIFSGNIHEELKETNEATIIESVLYWAPHVISGLKHLADFYKTVHIPCVVGNHGRLSRKPVSKNRVQDNFDWLFYNMLAMQLKSDPRFTWNISSSPDVMFTLYDLRTLLTHGDQFRGGTGISGPILPWMLGDHRKRKKAVGINRPYDLLIFGHWHTLALGVFGMIPNGSLKGYDEYADVMNFAFEPPQQAWWLVQPRVGVTARWPIHVYGDKERYS